MKNEFELMNDIEMDFDAYEEQELNELEREKMMRKVQTFKNKKKSYKKLAVLAACVASVAVLSQTAFAQNLFANILKTISTGHNQFMQTEPSGPRPVPEILQGKVFDKDGNPLEMIDENTKLYNAEGKEYGKEADLEIDGQTVDIFGGDDALDERVTNDVQMVVNDLDALQQHLNFDAKLPQYLPEGYAFDLARFYKDENGNVSGNYLDAEYINKATGETIYLNERIINEETAFETGTDGTMEETTINGNKAVIMDGTSIDWEADGVSVGIIAHGLEQEELIKVAESCQ